MYPLVSCLLCTSGNRREMAKQAIACYLSQDWPNKELVIVDDQIIPISDLIEDIPNVTYIHFAAKNLSEKRNVGCREARGDLIAHIDDDDYSASGRLTHQVGLMANAQVCGYKSSFWYNRIDGTASYYHGAVIWGASMMYRRTYALENPWDESLSAVEDAAFLKSAELQRAVVAADGGDLFVATLHEGNAVRPVGQIFSIEGGRRIPQWPFVPVASLPEGFRKVMNL